MCWVFVSVRGPSPAAASGGHSSPRCAGLSPSRPLLLRSTGSRRAGSVVVAHGLSCSAACGIFPDQGSNPCPLHRQADSQPLRHQGSPVPVFSFLMWGVLPHLGTEAVCAPASAPTASFPATSARLEATPTVRDMTVSPEIVSSPQRPSHVGKEQAA